MKWLFLVFLAITPVFFYAFFYYRKDKKKPEPKVLILKMFFIGFFLAVPAYIFESTAIGYYKVFSQTNSMAFHAYRAFFVAGLIEEALKLIAVVFFVYYDKHFDEIMDGILYAVIASLGFACSENIWYVLSSGGESFSEGIGTAIMRAILSLPLHATCSGLMGFFIGVAKFSTRKINEKLLIASGLLLAVIIHGYYDFVLFISDGSDEAVELCFIIVISCFIGLNALINSAIESDVKNKRVEQ